MIKKGKTMAILCWTCLFFISITMWGCSAKEQDKSGDPEDTAMGRYLETELKLPKETKMIHAVCRMADGSLRIAARDSDDKGGIFETKDGGKTWEQKVAYPKELTDDPDLSIEGALISDKGEMLLQVEDYAQVTGTNFKEGIIQRRLWKMDEKGAAKQLEVTDSSNETFNSFFDEWKFTDEGQVVGRDTQGKIYQLDPSAEKIVRTYEGDNLRYESFGIQGNVLIAVASGDMTMYDLATGKILETDSVLKNQLVSQADNSGSNTLSVSSVFQKGTENDSLFFCNEKGLFRHVLNGNISEQLISGELTSLSNPALYIQYLTIMDDGSFLVTCMDENFQSKMLKYTYTADAPSQPEIKVKAYALYDSDALRQSIVLYQNENPDKYIELEIGMQEKEAATVSDTLKKLNTEIMAGQGPDLLLLDGLPVRSYINKGILEDLSEVIAKISKSDGMMDNVVNAFSGDGKTYVVPARFSVPVIQAEENAAVKAVDLNSLADLAETISKGGKNKRVLEEMPSMALGSILYDVSARSWIKEDGTMDETKLNEFYRMLKRIYQADSHSTETEEAYEDSHIDSILGIDNGVLGFSEKINGMNIGNISSVTQLAGVISADKKAGSSTYKLLNGQSENVFVPRGMIGVSSKGTRKEEGMKLAEFLLSEEAQCGGMEEGLPVNKAAYDKIVENTKAGDIVLSIGGQFEGDEKFYLLNCKWPERKEAEEFLKYAESLTTASETDGILKEAVLEAVPKFIQGSVSEEDAVKAVMKKVNLYLSE